MWRQLEVDLEGTLNWSAFIAGLRCILIKQHSVSGRPWKMSAIWQAGKETQQVIKPADIKYVPSALLTGKNICSFTAKAPNAGRRRRESGVFFIYLSGLICENPTFSKRSDSWGQRKGLRSHEGRSCPGNSQMVRRVLFMDAESLELTQLNWNLDSTKTSVLQAGQLGESCWVEAGGAWAEQ